MTQQRQDLHTGERLEQAHWKKHNSDTMQPCFPEELNEKVDGMAILLIKKYYTL